MLRTALASILLASLLTLSAAGANSFYILDTVTAAQADHVASQFHLQIVKPIGTPSLNVYLVQSAGPLNATAISAIKASAGVQNFEGDSEIGSTPTVTPHTPQSVQQLANFASSDGIGTFYGSPVRNAYVDQFGAGLIRAASSRNSFGAGAGIVAVIDTGIDPRHPGLKNSIVPGYDFVRNVAGVPNEFSDLAQSTVGLLDQSTVGLLDSKLYPAVLAQSTVGLLDQSTVGLLDQSTVGLLDGVKLPSDFGHGTMVSGLIHLVAPNAQIMPLKAFTADGKGQLSSVVQAIYYAVAHHAKVINMSFNFDQPSAALTAAIGQALSQGVICVAASGNAGKEVKVYPAAIKGVIGVGSTSNLDKRSTFSNYGDGVFMASPGEALITFYPGGHYAGVWGTSFSTPLVSGAAALLVQMNSQISVSAVRDALDHGKNVDLDMGDTRLDTFSSLLFYVSHR